MTLRAATAGPESLGVPQEAPNPDELSSLQREVETLRGENMRLYQRNAEVSLHAYKWMVAHDMRAAGKPYDYPEPADLPKSEARAQSAEARLAKAMEAGNATVSELMRCTQGASDRTCFAIANRLSQVLSDLQADGGAK